MMNLINWEKKSKKKLDTDILPQISRIFCGESYGMKGIY